MDNHCTEKQSNAIASARLCSSCNKFYGSAEQNFMCSACFKQIQQDNVLEKANPEKSSAFKNLPVNEIVEEKSPKIEFDPKRCYKCNKKIGISGFECKCGPFFCATHRLPEVHDCKRDFQEEGKKQLAEANPEVKFAKLEKI